MNNLKVLIPRSKLPRYYASLYTNKVFNFSAGIIEALGIEFWYKQYVQLLFSESDHRFILSFSNDPRNGYVLLKKSIRGFSCRQIDTEKYKPGRKKMCKENVFKIGERWVIYLNSDLREESKND